MTVQFKLQGRVLCEYSTFEGVQEILETRELLAYENGVDKDAITVTILLDVPFLKNGRVVTGYTYGSREKEELGVDNNFDGEYTRI